MAVVIRMQRAGARNRPFWRIVVADSRKARDGRFLEKVGYYDPVPEKEVISFDWEKIEKWMSRGAKPSEAVRSLMKRAKAAGGSVGMAKVSGDQGATSAQTPSTPAQQGSAEEPAPGASGGEAQ